MSIPTSSSSFSFKKPYVTLFEGVNAGVIRDVQGIKSSCHIESSDQLIEIIKNGINELNKDAKCQSALVRLLTITEGERDLHNKILTVCRENGLASNKLGPSTSSGPVEFTPFSQKVTGKMLVHDIMRVHCLGQDGAETASLGSRNR